MNRAAGLIATSVLADSAIEHYRGMFHNKAMVTPIVTASLSLMVSAHGNADTRPAAHIMRDTAYSAAALAGIAGLGFHLYNVSKKPGGFSWQNLSISAPIGAPLALVLSGAMGYLVRTRARYDRRARPRRSAAFRRDASWPPPPAPA